MAMSELAEPRTLDEIARSGVSLSISKALQAMPGYGSSVMDISVFLQAVRTTLDQGTGAETVVRKLFGDAQFVVRLQRTRAASLTETITSPGLSEAFQDAHDIRARTGGQDRYIGMRHVLFSIFTSAELAIRSEISDLFSRVGVSQQMATEEICHFVDRAMEQEESRQVWAEIFAERGLPALSSGTGFPPASADREKIAVRERPGPEVALLGSDDPWSAGAKDRSGAQAEADAFAAMISARQFVPPLAIGIFGEWGSGKSFFMRLVYDAIEQRRLGAAEAMQADGAAISLLDNVVQVRFNAWHYAETNLWASLVDHIFTSLDRWAEKANQKDKTDKVFERLATARKLTIESAEALVEARRERKAAEEHLKEANTELAQRKADLAGKPSTWARTAFDQLIGDKKPDQKKAVQDAADMLGLGPITTNVSELGEAGAKLDDAVASYGIVRSATLRRLMLPWVVGVVTILVLVLPPLLAWLSDVASRFMTTQIPPVAAAVSGALAPLVAALGWATKKTREATDKVRAFHADLQNKVEDLARKEKAAVAEAQKQLDDAAAQVGQAEERLRVASEEAALAANDYNLRSGKGRVLRFVRDRVATGDYAKHLGFIATVRKDFEELSALMAPSENAVSAEKARQASEIQVRKVIADAGSLLDQSERDKLIGSVTSPDAELQVFERIVLYIDDLDRCPPKQVVDVLQAIHLLLTFPLFVVMVAVDVRWVREALAKHYPDQIDEKARAGANGAATAGDYLEKIFQIPYWVRAMTADNTRQLLEDRLGPDAVDEMMAAAPAKAVAKPTTRASKSARGRAVAQAPAAAPAPVRRLSGLHITPDERAFMMQVANVLDNSPRRTLRFVNSYRLIKASLPDEAADRLEAGGYRALLTLLAIGTCAGGPGAEFLAGLRQRRPPAITPAAGDLEAMRVAEAHKLYGTNSAGNANLFDYAPLAARFSFEDR
ncbi:P-loop NTPase fold protein [Mesorhizobium sp.]|uniref:P-loop NTPase fold protein n=1 Tax=Mesorhizobium sp. TaxID=1871066 RepID=UPI0025D2A742|nr:P-loop NTPase fold protein [Mesorhizobium sp.]